MGSPLGCKTLLGISLDHGTDSLTAEAIKEMLMMQK